MELFLNLCWLALLLPAYLLWRRRTMSDRNASFALICTLGCVLVLLFPVISASDDLHAMRPETDETERAFRHAGHRGGNLHQLTHSSHSPHPALVSSAAPTIFFQQVDTVVPAPLARLVRIPASASFCRPPPAVA